MHADLHLLTPWGWNQWWDAALSECGVAGVPGRVVGVDRGQFSLRLADGPARGVWRPSRSNLDGQPPSVGDWCVINPPDGDGPAVVHTILPRRTSLTRKASGKAARDQVLAANADKALLVCGLDRTQGIRSLERYLTLVLDGGLMPLVVLNKTDLCDDVETQAYAAERAAPGFGVIAVSATTGVGLDALRAQLPPGSTAVLLGPSGAGKSSLINALSGAEMASTGNVRESDQRGRHTSVRRQLYRLPGDAMLIDSPGLRVLAAWVQADGLSHAFADIESLAESCRFRDCTHDTEPGCAVRAALEDGDLGAERFLKYLELAREAEALAQRRGNSKRRFRDISRFVRQIKQERDWD